MALPALGDTFAGKYRIDRVIGEGGMGIVFEAFHTGLQQRVAIKMLRPDVLSNRTVTGRFEREARAAAKLQGPNVAKVLDVDAVDGHPYLVMEFLDGHDLMTELEQRQKLPIPEAVGYVLEACIPIAQAHGQGIVHRDLKPSNLFLANVDGKRVVKLLDFGISKFVAEGSKLTAGTEALGTPEYMSPEQIRQTANVDHRGDIWSLGVILYELLTGTVPFEGAPSAIIAAVMTETIVPPRVTRREIPEPLDKVIMHALEKDPNKRFQSVSDLAQALEPFATDTPLQKGTLESLPPPAALAELLEGDEPAPLRRTMRSWESMPPAAKKRGKASWLVALVIAGAAAGGVVFWRQTLHRGAVVTAAAPASQAPSASVAAAEPSASAAPAVSTHEPEREATPVASASAAVRHAPASRFAAHHPATPEKHPSTQKVEKAPPAPTNMFDQRF